MKIALVFATASLRRGTRLKHFMVPPHSLQILSAVTPQEHDVVIYDEYHRLAPKTLKADIVEEYTATHRPLSGEVIDPVVLASVPHTRDLGPWVYWGRTKEIQVRSLLVCRKGEDL